MKSLLTYGIELGEKYFPHLFRRKIVPTEADPREQSTYDYDRDRREYRRAFVAGELDTLLGRYVAYHDGKIVAKAPTELGLAREIIPLNLEGRCLIVHVGAGPDQLGF